MAPELQGEAFDAGMLLESLQAILPPAPFCTNTKRSHPTVDGLSAYRRRPLFVCLPETVEQVRQILRLCHERHVPVVARGAGAGLSGGALPHEAAYCSGWRAQTHPGNRCRQPHRAR